MFERLNVLTGILGLGLYDGLDEFAAWAFGESRTMIFVTAALAGLAIYKHKANIQRLINGTENRIGAKRGLSADAPKPTS